MKPEELKAVIEKRRSIFPKSYGPERIDDIIVEQMLECANWAPTHGRTEPWRFVVFTGDGLQKLADFQASLYKNKSEAEGTFDERKFNKLQNNPLRASHVIALCMKRDTRGKIPEIEEVEAVACAVQNMHLMATAHGVGCYWGSGGITYMEDAKPFFGLESTDKLLGFMYVGKPSIEWPIGKRTPIEDKVTWVLENN